ncbi:MULTISPECIES: bifunctional diguanylate cyclase/phosphodiesterase [unclassified Halomonas]|uniref:bifunctional diguanylate cyclase/phosphodiesterase n=1 Tax=unclassified Halomonas TaxID=2609666 RepID=UPI002076B928|nr:MULTISPECIES: bifunctional diguanylate cyclase/phosphodiesterase [unclassified Halomonas]
MQKKDETAETFRQLARGFGREDATRFYLLMAEKLAQLLQMDHVLIAVYSGDRSAQALAFWSQGQTSSHFTYSLEGTPCETITEHAPCHYFEKVQALFPQDDLLKSLNAQSYVGFPVFGSNNALLGFIAVLANRALIWGKLENDILMIAAAQLGTELERRETERALKKSERLARESERRLNTLLNHLPGMAYRCLDNRRRDLKLVSLGARALTGYSVRALKAGQAVTLGNLIHDEDRERVFAELNNALKAQSPYRLVYRLRHRDGCYRWVWEQGQGVFDSRGATVCLEGFICDITEQHESVRVKNAVVQVASSVTSRVNGHYFKQLIATLIALLEADGGFIALLDQPLSLKTLESQALDEHVGRARVTTESLVVRGISLPAHTFDLFGSPCERVVLEQEAVVQDSGAMALPAVEFCAKAWIGRRLDNAAGEAIGVMMVFYQTPLSANAFATSVLRILSNGAAAELERQRDHRRIEYLAYIDTTTGLPNRARFMERLTAFTVRVHALSLVLLDIKDFREINDLHGHAVGDELLIAVAGRLQAGAPTGAFIARLSSNEFAVLFDKAEGKALDTTALQLENAVCQPVCLNHLTLLIGINIGLAHYPDTVEAPDDLFNAATLALHHAKRTAQTRCRYQPALRVDIQRRQELTERLQLAISEQTLELYFQPQLDLVSGELAGAEALCRWYDAQWGWINPCEFIVLAEERGLINPLGEWVLGQAAAQLKAWAGAGTPLTGRLSVNVSAQQFANPQLLEKVMRLTQGVAPQALGLELTESAVMRSPDQAVLTTQALREAGYTIAIDDFGTGYSSLSYLRRFAADVLKIDISFVRHIVDNPQDQAITQTIIDIAKTLGIKPLAEGVESEAQARLLTEMGCHQGQGDWLGEPLDRDAFARRWLGA